MPRSLPRIRIRYSFAAALFLVTCLCGWLSGYRSGYQAGDSIWQYKNTYTKAYNVADLVTPIPNSIEGGQGGVDFDPLLAIFNRVAANDQEPKPGFAAFPMNLSILVTGNGVVHRRVSEVLSELRELSDADDGSRFES